MKRFLILFIALTCVMLGAIAKGNKIPQYDITGAGSGTEGTILVKVYIFKNKVSDEELKQVAVHGVVFRGVSTGNMSGARQPAMASPTAETENATLCEEFFAEDGECQKYASIIPGSYEHTKSSKGNKCGAIIQIDKASLRKTLEKLGIVRSLGSGF